MTKFRVWVAALSLATSAAALAAPLMPAESFIPRLREAALLTPEEARLIQGYRNDTDGYTSARLFRANMTALHSAMVDVEVEGKSQRYFARERTSVTQDPVTQAITEHAPDFVGADGYLWSGATSENATGPPTARFSWGGPDEHSLSGQFVIDGKMYSIGTLGRFHVLLVSAHPLSAIPGAGPVYQCDDSFGAKATDTQPVKRCDRPQHVGGRSGPPIPPTLTDSEGEPFKHLHTKLRVSPLSCGSDEITFCEKLVRISCNAGGDAPVRFFDNESAELLGTCGFWVHDGSCTPQRWKACAVKNGVSHIIEEPDPSR